MVTYLEPLGAPAPMPGGEMAEETRTQGGMDYGRQGREVRIGKRLDPERVRAQRQRGPEEPEVEASFPTGVPASPMDGGSFFATTKLCVLGIQFR